MVLLRRESYHFRNIRVEADGIGGV